MKYEITYTNGRLPVETESIQAAAEILLGEYPDGVIYDAGGWQHGPEDMDELYDVRSGHVALVWRCEAESVNDDGSRSVAEIREAAQ